MGKRSDNITPLICVIRYKEVRPRKVWCPTCGTNTRVVTNLGGLCYCPNTKCVRHQDKPFWVEFLQDYSWTKDPHLVALQFFRGGTWVCQLCDGENQFVGLKPMSGLIACRFCQAYFRC